MIPIVLGGANYSDPNIAIPGSFINVQDFPSVKELAGYLLKVASNDTLFNSYFEWRGKYKLVEPYGWPYVDKAGWPCELCRKIQERRYIPKVYHNLSREISVEHDCKIETANIEKLINRSYKKYKQ